MFSFCFHLEGAGLVPVHLFLTVTRGIFVFEHIFHLVDAVVADDAVEPVGRGDLGGVIHLLAAIAADGFFVFHALIIPDVGSLTNYIVGNFG